MGIHWPWRKQQPPQKRSLISISDPAFAALVGATVGNYSGVTVDETTALALSAVWRAVSLIAGTLAGLPLRTIAERPDGTKERVQSFLDAPGGQDGSTRYEWVETVLVHLLLHGNAYLIHVRGGAGQLLALIPVHPLCVSVARARTWPDGRPVAGGKIFSVTLDDGSRVDYDASGLLHIPALSTDGFLGLSPITIAANSLGTATAGDRAAAKLFSQGSLISGLVSADGDDVDDEEEPLIRQTLERNVSGWENASAIRFVNRKLKFTSWSMSAEDAQFLQSRQFQIEEIARWFGVPPHLLMQTDKQTSWGTGVAESNRGMGRTVLAPWASRIEQRLSRLMRGRFAEFDFTGLERPAPEQEIALLVQQLQVGLLTLNEARAVRNLPPVDGGDLARINGQPLVQGVITGAPNPGAI